MKNNKIQLLIQATISVFVFGVMLFIVPDVYAQGTSYVADPTSCPVEDASIQSGVSCSGGELICGATSNQIYCYDNSSLSPASSSTTESTSYGASFDTNGGYVVDCYANDGTAPRCDNSGNFLCNKKTECVNLSRVTQCTAGVFSASGSGAASCQSGTLGTATGCISGTYNCFDDDGNGANGTCEASSGSNYRSSALTNATYGGSCGATSCKSGYIDCDDASNDPDDGDSTGVTDTDGCEETLTNTGYNNSEFTTGSTGYGAGGFCGVSCSSGSLSCTAAGGTSTVVASDYDAAGCNITASSTVIDPSAFSQASYLGISDANWDGNVLHGSSCGATICSGTTIDCDGATLGTDNDGNAGTLDSGKGSDGSCEQTSGGDASAIHNANTEYLRTSGSCRVQCATGYYNFDGNISNGCEVQDGATCDPGDGTSGTYSCTTSTCTCDSNPVVSFETGVQASYSTNNALLWGTQDGSGPLISFTNSNDANALFYVANDGDVSIGTSSASTVLHVDSNAANTTAIFTLENTAGNIQLFRTDATPESSVTGSVGDLAIDGTNGQLYIKASGDNTNSGWTTVGSSTVWAEANGVAYLGNTTEDLLIGGTATSSAKFAFINVDSGTPTASVSAGVAGGTYLTADGTIATTAMQGLVLGTSTTGDITIDSGTGSITLSDNTTINGTLTISGEIAANGGVDVATGYDYQINNASVLNVTTLGSSVVNSSLTSVGALNSGSITSGFGSIDNGSSAITTLGTITGGTLTDGTISITGGNLTGATGVTATNLTGTLQTAAQTNVTSLGTLTALNVDNLNLDGNTITTTGVNSLVLDSNNALILLKDNLQAEGAATISGTLAVTGTTTLSSLTTDGVVTVTGGVLGSTANSALDAGTLDSLDSLQFLRSDTSDAFTSGTLTFNDSTILALGTSTDLTMTHNGTNTVLTSATGNLVIDNTNTTGATQIQLGTDTNATAFQVLNNTGATLFEVEAGGNVGIGTVSPGFTLDVNGQIGFAGDTRQGIVKVYNSATGDMFGIEQVSIAQSGISIPEMRLFTSETGSAGIGFGKYSNATDFIHQMVIDQDGNVGIGTTSPTGLLNVEGAVTGKALTILNETGDQDIFTASASGTTQFTIANSGNIAASGTITGLTGLTSSGTIILSGLTTDGVVTVASGVLSSKAEGSGGGLDADTLDSIDSLSFLRSDTSDAFTSGTLTFNDSTILALGTGTDLTMTHNGTNTVLTSATGNLVIDNTNATGSTQVQLGTDTTATDFQVLNDTGTALFEVDGSGNVGIGTASPTEKLHIDAGTFLMTPGDPSIVGEVQDAADLTFPTDVHISGKYAYVASYVDDSLRIVDISNPTNPTIVGGVQDATSLNGAWAVHVSGKYAYVAAQDNDTVQVIDVSNPTSPSIVGSVGTLNGDLNGIGDIYVSGKYAYTASWTDDSMRIIDISDPTNPTIVGGIKDATNLNGAYGVYVSGKYAYVAANADNSLRIIDVSDPTSPSIVGGVKNDTSLAGAFNVYVSGRYAYVVSEVDDSLRIIDVSNPASPSIVGGVDTLNGDLNGANGVYVSGKYAYVTSSGNDSLRIIDVSNPASPSIVGGLQDTSNLNYAYGVHVSGRYAYVVAGDDNSLQIVDIGGIDAPVASIGDLAIGSLKISENLDIANNLSIGNGLVVGAGGLLSQGEASIYASASATPALTVAQNSTGDILNLFDGTTEVFTVLDGGNVGIGTTSPNDALEVLSTTDAQLRLAYDTSNYQAGQVASDGGLTWSALGTDADLNFDFSGATDGDFSVNTNDLFVDTSTGYVGIGEITPLSALQVENSDSGNLREALRLTNSNTVAGSGTGVMFSVSPSGQDYAKAGIFFHTADGTGWARGDLHFAVNNAADTNDVGLTDTKMIILREGNVGIGDTSPAAMFTVGSGDLFQVNSSGAIAAATGVTSSGTVTFSGLTTDGVVTVTGGVLGSTANSSLDAGTLDSLDSLQFLRSDTSDSFTSGTLTFDDSTILALGTGTDFTLTHNGTNTVLTSATGNLLIDNTNATGSTQVQLGTDTTATTFQVLNNTGTSLFGVDGGGNVGIGTASPTSLLHVEGAVTGKALTILNETGDQDIFTASASGTTQFTIGNTGNIAASGTITGLTGITSSGTTTLSGLTTDGVVTVTGGVLGSTANSSLDAGTLDSLDSLQFLRSDTSDAFTSGTLTFNDSTILALGTGTDATLTHNGTNTVLTSATGNLVIDNTNTTGSTLVQLGTDTTATDFQVLNNTGTTLFEVNGAGDVTANALYATNNHLSFNSLDEELILNLPMSETGTTHYDRSVSGYDGTDTGTVSCSDANGKIGGGCDYDGSSGYTTLTGEGSGFSTDTFTAEAWIYRDTDSGGQEFIIDNRDAVGDGWILYVTSADVASCLYNSVSTVGTTTISTGQWHHVACSADGTDVKLYVNGIEADTATQTGSISESTDTIIGTRSFSTPVNYFPGKIDEVKVSGRGLSAAEIRSRYLDTVDGTSRPYIVDSTGYVGIGTTSPNDALEILSTTDAQLRLAYDTSNYQAGQVASDGGLTWSALGTDADLNFDFSGATDGDFSVNTNDLFVDTSSGYVGIGTTTPSYTLDIEGAINATGLVFDDGSAQLYGTTRDSRSGYLSTAKFKHSTSTAAQNSAGAGIFFKPNGLEMYVVGYSTSEVNQYTLTTAWDVSTASFTGVKDVSAENSIVTGVSFKPDGTKMYVGGQSGADEINEYTLSTPWTVTTALFSQVLDTSGQVGDTGDITFREDGVKLYIGDEVTNQIEEYTLSTPWDISTATYVQTGTAGGASTTMGIAFKRDGTRMYVVDNTSGTDLVREYTLTTPWDTSTAVSTGTTMSVNTSRPEGIFLSPSGHKLYLLEADEIVYEYDLGFVSEGGGYFGIGTSAPNDVLEILSTSDAQLRLAYDTSNYQAGQVASDGGLTWSALGTDADLNFDFSGATDGDFSVNTDDLFVDTSSGYVGIGTTTLNDALDVSGNIRTDGRIRFANQVNGVLENITAGGNFQLVAPSSGVGILIRPRGEVNDGQLQVHPSGYSDFYNTSGTIANRIHTNGVSYFNGGNVGIGTTSPNDALEILSTTDAQLRLAYDTSNYQAGQVASDGGLTWSALGTDADLNFDFSGATDGDFSVNTDDLFVDTSTSRVGIGTVSPGYTLDVNGQIGFAGDTRQGIVKVYNSATGDMFGIEQVSGVQSGISIPEMRLFTSEIGSAGIGFGKYSDATNFVHQMVINQGGDVGVGSSSPESRLQVTGGGLCVGSDANCNTDNDTEGVVYSSSTAMTAYDVAEMYPTLDESIGAGEVVALDANNGVFVKRAQAGDKRLLGVVSTRPGVLLGGFAGDQFIDQHQVPIALAGRIPTQVSTENGNIEIGDFLTLSSQAGVARKANDGEETIGYALQNYSSNEVGNIEVFVNLDKGSQPLQLLDFNQTDNLDASSIDEGLVLGVTTEELDDSTVNMNIFAGLEERVTLLEDEISALATSSAGLTSPSQDSPLFEEMDENMMKEIIDQAELGVLSEINYRVWSSADGFIFKAKVWFKDTVEFASSVIFKGSITVNTDTAGIITIPAGKTKVKATFNTPFEKVPAVNLTPAQKTEIDYSLDQVNEESFIVVIAAAQEKDLSFNWTALIIEGDPIQVEVIEEDTSHSQVKILESSIGYVRVRAEATILSNQVGEVLPGELYTYDQISENGWYHIHLDTKLSGWITGDYVEEVAPILSPLPTSIPVPSPTPTQTPEAIESPSPIPTQAPEATASPSPTPTQTPEISVSPLPTPEIIVESENRIQVNSSELGFVRMRVDSNSDAEEISQIPDGTQLEYYAEEFGWYQVDYQNNLGWVSGLYVVEIE